jgi:hypothetical protein
MEGFASSSLLPLAATVPTIHATSVSLWSDTIVSSIARHPQACWATSSSLHNPAERRIPAADGARTSS